MLIGKRFILVPRSNPYASEKVIELLFQIDLIHFIYSGITNRFNDVNTSATLKKSTDFIFENNSLRLNLTLRSLQDT